jgi:hypothetical protein
MKPAAPATVPAAGWRAAAAPLALIALGLGLGLGARYGLVEPASLTQTCDAAPWRDLTCTLRTLTVRAFVDQRLALLALGLAVLAVSSRWRWATGSAMATGSAALVLYSADIAAPAVLLAALAWVQSATAGGPLR